MFSKGLWGYLPANVLQGLVGFATLMAFTRLLSPTDYGAYVLALGVSSVANTLVFTWLHAAMARFYPAERIDNPQAPVLYGTVYRLFIVVACAFLLIVGVALALWPANNPLQRGLKLAIGLGLVSTVSKSLAKLIQEQRRSEGRVAAAAGIDMLQTGGGFVFALLFALGGLKGAAPLLGAGVMACLILPFFAAEDWGRARRGRFEIKAAWVYAHYGFPVSLGLVLSIALYTVDRFMIAHYLTEADAGAYHAGFSIASRVIDVIFIWFGAAGAPAMIHALEAGGAGELKAEGRRQLTMMCLILFPAVAGLIAIAGPLSTVLIGERLRGPALSIAPLVTVGALMAGLNNGYFLLSFTLAKNTRLLVVAMAVPAVANIALNLILIPRLGLVGAALAYALSFLIGILTAWGLSFRVTPLPVPLLELGKIAAAASVMALGLSWTPRLGTAPDLILKPLAGVLVYSMFAYGLDLGGVRALVDDQIRRRAPWARSGP